jgi:hypothetical protein
MMTLNKIIKAIINNEHGWAVADQFEDTFSNNEPFEQQNTNALRYIRNVIRYDILGNNVFSDEAMNELREYYDKLAEYLVEYLEEAKQ